jgi:formylglycine-generating enzyme required for sulfatase activity
MGGAGIFARLLASLALVALLVGLSANGAQAAAKFTSYYRGAQVWRDKVPDKVYDPAGELSYTTAEDGSFAPPPGKGRLYLQGGVHIVTGQPNRLTLAAPRNATGVSAMTSLWQSLLDRKLSDKQIQGKLQASVVNFTVAKDIAQASDKTRAAVRTDVQVDVLAQFVEALSNARYGACRDRTQAKTCKAESGHSVIESLADAVQTQAQVALNEQAPVQDILGKTLEGLGIGLDADNLGGTAMVAASLNVQADRVVIDERQQEKLNTLFKIIANAGDLLENRDFQNFVLQYVQTNLVNQVDTGKLYLPPPRLSLNPADDTGLDAHDGVTKKSAPGLVIERVAAGAAGVNVYLEGVKAGAAAPISGQPSVWTFKSGVLSDGTHIFAARAVSENDGESADSNALLATVDTLAPLIPSVASTLDFDTGTPFLQGGWSGDASDLFKISLDDGNAYVLGDGNLFATGASWTLTIPKSNQLSLGAHQLLLTDTDLAGNQSVSPAYTLTVSSGPAQVSVPNVVGLTQAAAINAFSASGLSLGTVSRQSSDSVASGLVIGQNPAAGTSVVPGSSVSLVISSGPSQPTQANVPNVVGLTQAVAANTLAGAGLSVGTVTRQNSATVAAGVVISQNPVAGSSVASGTAVTLTISSGATQISVPDIVQQSQSAATTVLNDMGLLVGTVTQQCSDTVTSGFVISQTPAAGSFVAIGASVALTVSTGDCNIVEPVMVRLTGGTFRMGSPDSEAGRDSGETQHTVTIDAFSIGKYEVTQGQWKAVLGSNPSSLSSLSCGDDCPVETVSWDDVQVYIGRLNQMTGKRYRLPTEAEWEYACRSGGAPYQLYCGSDDVDAVAWYKGNISVGSFRIHPIGGKTPNAFGLYDMSGNVREWTCSDYASSYDGHELTCSNGTGFGSLRAVRGGYGLSDSDDVRSASRFRFFASSALPFIGFRLAQD